MQKIVNIEFIENKTVNTGYDPSELIIYKVTLEDGTTVTAYEFEGGVSIREQGYDWPEFGKEFRAAERRFAEEAVAKEAKRIRDSYPEEMIKDWLNDETESCPYVPETIEQLLDYPYHNPIEDWIDSILHPDPVPVEEAVKAWVANGRNDKSVYAIEKEHWETMQWHKDNPHW